MNCHQWVQDGIFHYYGKMEDNKLKNTKGIRIIPMLGVVNITHFNQNGLETMPMIKCAADEFTIYE
jgi:hypothetical protein